MLHFVYIIAFTIIAFLAITNLIRSLITVSVGTQRGYSSRSGYKRQNLHPELLDETGKPFNEPLLVMKSVTVEDARQQLDALYNASPSKTVDSPEKEEDS